MHVSICRGLNGLEGLCVSIANNAAGVPLARSFTTELKN
jgi:hypothetical protein